MKTSPHPQESNSCWRATLAGRVARIAGKAFQLLAQALPRMEPHPETAGSNPAAASAVQSMLTIRAPASQQSAPHDDSAGGMGESITVRCGDSALDAITHHWATVESVQIGEHPAIVWYSPSRDAAYAHVKESEKCQQGQVRIVARCRRKAPGVYRYITPYTYAALKIQDKVCFIFGWHTMLTA